VQVTISARHGQLGTDTQQRITEKVDKLRRFFERITSIHITVDLEHTDQPAVEIRVSAEHSDDFVGHDSANTVLTALDRVIHKVENQLRKHKEKITGHRATGHKHLDMAPDEESASDDS